MNLLKLLVASAAVGVILTAFRDFERGTWLLPAGLGETGEEGEEREPILGYDGMDEETLVDWLTTAELDRATLLRVRRYEERGRRREPVLATVADLL